MLTIQFGEALPEDYMLPDGVMIEIDTVELIGVSNPTPHPILILNPTTPGTTPFFLIVYNYVSDGKQVLSRNIITDGEFFGRVLTNLDRKTLKFKDTSTQDAHPPTKDQVSAAIQGHLAEAK